MGSTKKHFYPKDNLLYSGLFKALGHPARLTIVKMLSKNETLNCTDFQRNIKLSQSTISDHCQILHQNGIIGYEIVGNNCFYRLDNGILDQLSEFLESVNLEITPLSNSVYYPRHHA